jgi:hypothetical protein
VKCQVPRLNEDRNLDYVAARVEHAKANYLVPRIVERRWQNPCRHVQLALVGAPGTEREQPQPGNTFLQPVLKHRNGLNSKHPAREEASFRAKILEPCSKSAPGWAKSLLAATDPGWVRICRWQRHVRTLRHQEDVRNGRESLGHRRLRTHVCRDEPSSVMIQADRLHPVGALADARVPSYPPAAVFDAIAFVTWAPRGV